ncbi:MAG TPA: hypothetical protein VFZ21_07430 [Gemmatimonadaceae bacterium]|nr:hypothetical protein [Gemmatimonadaceae bacterium]
MTRVISRPIITLLCLSAAAIASACSDQPTTPVGVNVPSPQFGKGGVSSGAHFLSADGFFNPVPTVQIDFRLAGMGAGTTVTVTATATAVAVEACVNGGDNVPSDRKKRTTQTHVETSGQFPATAGGNVEGTLFLTFPPTTLNCPSGQVATLIDGSWTNVQLSTPSPSGGPVLSIGVSGNFDF